MGRLKNTLVTILVCVTIGLGPLTMSACDNGKQNAPVEPNVSGPTTPEPSEPTPPYEEEDPVWTDQPYNDAVANIANLRNYTYSFSDSKGTTTWELDGDAAFYLAAGNRIGVFRYVDEEDGKSYQLEWKADQYYHKTDIDDFDADSLILDDLMNAVLITDYDQDLGLYTATLNGKTYSLGIDGSNLTFEGDAETIKVKDVGSTTVDMPAENRIIDETHKEDVEPNPPVNPDDDKDDDKHEEEVKLFTETNGVRTYNSKLLGETIQEILNTVDEQTGATLFSRVVSGFGSTVDELLFVSSGEGDIKLGTISKMTTGKDALIIFTVPQAVAEGFSADKQDWAEGLKKYGAITTKALRANLEESETNQETLKQVVSQCFEKVATVGVQASSYKKGGVVKERYKDAEIIRVFEQPDGTDGEAGYDLGITHRKGFAVLLKDANDIPMWVTMNVATTDRISFEESILNPTINDHFVVFRMETELELDKDFFDDKSKGTATTVESTAAKQVALPADKGKQA